jgi:hypothetical protein
MNPGALGVLIPIIAVAGFFGWMIALTVSKAYTAKLEAQRHAASRAGVAPEELLVAVDELRREVAELAERVDFTERLLAKETSSREGRRAST